MEKVSKKLIKKVWSKYAKCKLYINATKKIQPKIADD
mgnify:CR=1 FL=1